MGVARGHWHAAAEAVTGTVCHSGDSKVVIASDAQAATGTAVDKTAGRK